MEGGMGERNSANPGLMQRWQSHPRPGRAVRAVRQSVKRILAASIQFSWFWIICLGSFAEFSLFASCLVGLNVQ